MNRTYIYRLHTEDKGDDSVEQQVTTYFDAFTVLRGTGYWEGKQEKTMIIEIVSADPFASTWLDRIARSINRMNDQDCCLVTRTETITKLIDGRP